MKLATLPKVSSHISCRISSSQPSEKSDSIDLADDITSSSHHVLADTSLSGGCAVDRKTAADDGLGSRSSCRLKAEGTKKPSYQWRPGSVEKTGSRTNLKESSTMISSPLVTTGGKNRPLFMIANEMALS